MTERLTQHFRLNEALRESGADVLPIDVRANVQHVAEVMEEVRALLGHRSITPTSWYRTPTKNESVLGAAAHSAHTKGFAVDFVVQGLDAYSVARLLQPYVRKLGIDQLIQYATHVHISADPRRRGQLLKATRIGTDTTYAPWTTTEHPTAAAPRALVESAQTGTRSTPSVPRASLPAPAGESKGTVLWWLAIVAGIVEVARRALSAGAN